MVSGQQHSPAALYPRGKTRYPFYRRLGGPQDRSGHAENLVPTGIRSWTVQPVVSRYIDLYWMIWDTDWATRSIPTHRTAPICPRRTMGKAGRGGLHMQTLRFPSGDALKTNVSELSSRTGRDVPPEFMKSYRTPWQMGGRVWLPWPLFPCKSDKYYIFWACVSSISYHSMPNACAMFTSVVCPAPQYIFSYIIS